MTIGQALPDQVYSPEFTRDPYSLFARLREQAPVCRVTTHGGISAWLVTRYADVRALLADSRLGKDGNRISELMARRSKITGIAVGFPPGLTNMVHSDPPDHTRLRHLVGREFTGHRVENLRPRVEELVDDQLDGMAAAGDKADLAQTLSRHLPIAVIGELLGVPAADRLEFFEWADTLYGGGTASADAVGQAHGEIVGYLGRLCDTKRDVPADDLLTALVQVSADQDRLSREELVSMALLLLVAAHETTSKQITDGVLALLLNPAQLELLRAQPALVAGAVEELLRYAGPSLVASLRFTTEPVEVAGVVIPEGEFVLLSLASGNRDPEKFPDPDRLAITRSTQGNLAMGHGIHHCVGAALARLELQIVFSRLLARFPHLALAVDPDELEWLVHSFFRAPTRLPVSLGDLSK
jgi:cytochrome P450